MKDSAIKLLNLYGIFIIPLVKEIRELTAKVEQLAKEIAVLTGK